MRRRLNQKEPRHGKKGQRSKTSAK
jgi:hypothetical protein